MLHLRRLLLVSATAALTSVVSANSADVYVRSIKPLLRNKCIACHGAIKQEGGLRLDTVAFMRVGGDSGSAIEPPSAGELPLLLQRVTGEDAGERMPPEAAPLSQRQIDTIAKWLRTGAVGPTGETPQQDPADHWAFQPPERPNLPPARGGNRHPIDRFIEAQLADIGLQAVERADTTTLIRRLFLDLHGLPPEAQQLERWQREFNSEGTDRSLVVEKLIDWLLASPRYGERWAQHWLDVVRYADTHGFEVNTPRPNAWPYRDYVIEALNQDVPYDRVPRLFPGGIL